MRVSRLVWGSGVVLYYIEKRLVQDWTLKFLSLFDGLGSNSDVSRVAKDLSRPEQTRPDQTRSTVKPEIGELRRLAIWMD